MVTTFFTKHLELRQRAHIGFASDVGRSLWVLSGTIRINIEIDAMVLEPDQCHISKILVELRLSVSKIMKTLRHLQAEKSKTLEPQAATLHRNCTMRPAFLAQDIGMYMQAPREGHMMALKWLARFLLGNPSCALVFSGESTKGADLQVHVHSDWAGNLESRRSTTGMMIRRGKHYVRHMSWLN